jgi:hypothetical protein
MLVQDSAVLCKRSPRVIMLDKKGTTSRHNPNELMELLRIIWVK